MGDNVEETPATEHASGLMPAHFTADRLVIKPVVQRLWGPLPFVTRRGIDVAVAIIVANTGEEAGLFTAALVLDGEVMGWRDVRIGAGEQRDVSFLVENVSRGTHWVSLAGFTATFISSRSINWPLIVAAGCVAAGAAAIIARQLDRR
ncbi:MAG: hypothetical protein ACOC9B_00835 [Chloroflexota bacterium]